VAGRHSEIVFDQRQIQGLAPHLKRCLDIAQASRYQIGGPGRGEPPVTVSPGRAASQTA
jgi:hypothetical protein